ncbi:hypothetical protein F5Y14DRAFT_407636 [Nemania sp. NC0429]|nr:hypothetical protein F5Y14DRAFT_407636 [Nemania sp. NC0429]
MKATLIPLFVLASYVSAETTACAALSILDACLDTTQGYVSQCGLQDFSCLCDKYTAIMTCFGNCPDDDRQYSFDSSRQLYCANAIAFATKTTTTSSPSKTSEPTQTSDSPADSSSSATTTFGDGSNNSKNTPSPTPNAAAVAGQYGAGLLAVLAGGVAAALL